MTLTAPPLNLLPKPGLLIGDQRIDDTSGGVFDHVYGATGQSTSEVTLAGPREIDLAVQAARSALPAWRATAPDQRRELMIRSALCRPSRCAAEAAAPRSGPRGWRA